MKSPNGAPMPPKSKNDLVKYGKFYKVHDAGYAIYEYFKNDYAVLPFDQFPKVSEK